MLLPPSAPDIMDPPRPPYQSYPGRAYKADAAPNPLYNMHVNAASAGPSNLHHIAANPHPYSTASPVSPTALYPTHLASHARAPAMASKPSRAPVPASAPLPPPALPSSLMPGSSPAAVPRDSHRDLESTLFFKPGIGGFVNPSLFPPGPPTHNHVQSARRSSSPGISRSPPLVPLKPWSPGEGSTSTAASANVDHRPRPPPKSRSLGTSASHHSDAPALPSSDDDELARALKLSMQARSPEQMREEEEDILARVIAESLASISASTSSTGQPQSPLPSVIETTTITDSLASHASSPQPLAPPSPHVRETYPESGVDHNEILTQSLPESAQATVSHGNDFDRVRAVEEARQHQLAADEEFARQLLREEANAMRSSKKQLSASPAVSTEALVNGPASPTTYFGRPPQYDGSKPPPVRPTSFHTLSMPESLSMFSQASRNSDPSRSLPPMVHSLNGRISRPASRGSNGSSAHSGSIPSIDRLGRSQSAQAALPTLPLPIPRPLAVNNTNTGADVAPALAMNTRPNTVIPVANLADAGSDEGPGTPVGRPRLVIDGMRSNGSSLEGGDESGVESSRVSPLTPDSAEAPGLRDEGRLVTRDDGTSSPMVERDLLQGVSFGFNTPPMSNIHTPMQGLIPNIIQLPFGRCPPLHIQAPSWKHLLKLLTRLDSSRIESTMEALAAFKFEMKLRTVIQFMKLHHASNDWRVIIYLTIDMPIPPQTINSHKYTNGDVTVLPYSYTTSPLPALLRAGAGDSQLSKCFTVPATPGIPFPTLPVSLPDYAMYLHAVLEASRRASNDSTSGFRRLAKLVDSLYPQSLNVGLGPEFNGPDRRGVSSIFKRVMGRNKSSQVQRGGNADTFEFITPFRMDEYH